MIQAAIRVDPVTVTPVTLSAWDYDLGDADDLVSLDDPQYTVPLYQKAEAARIIRVPRGTLRDWASPASSALRPADVQAALAAMKSSEARQAIRLLTSRSHWTDSELRLIIDRLPRDDLDMIRSSAPALITTAPPVTPRGPTVPFVGLTGRPAVIAPPALTFFVDRSLGSFMVPNALKAAGWVLETMDER